MGLLRTNHCGIDSRKIALVWHGGCGDQIEARDTIAAYLDALCNLCARALTLVITSAPRRFVSNPARSRALSSRATISRRVLTRAAISECTGGGDTMPR